MIMNRLGTAAFVLLLVSASGCKQKASQDPAAGSSSVTAAATSDKPAGVVFTHKAPAVGDKRDEDETMDMNMDISVDLGNGKPQKSDIKQHEATKKVVEVLALNGDAPSKVKVTYGTVEKKMTEGGKDKGAKASPISGKTYIVDSAGGKISVTDPSGKPAPSQEAHEVEKHFKSLGKPDPLTASIPTTPLKPGDKVDAMANAIGEYLNRDSEKNEGVKVSNVNVTFKEQSGDEGIFDIALTVSKEDKEMGLAIDLKGNVHALVKTSQPTKFDMKGPVKVSGGNGGGKMKIDGTGDMKLSMTSK